MSKSVKSKSIPKSGASPIAISWMEKPLESQKRKIYVIIFAIAFLFYGNTLWNGYSMDDELVIENHQLVSKGISAIPKIFTSRYAVNDNQSYEYRPITVTSFAIEHQFFGSKPAASHFINILLYALSGIVLFHLLLLIFKNQHWSIPLFVVLIFLIHPIHSEVVASIKNRDELLSFLFGLMSIKYFFRLSENWKWSYILFGLLYMILSLLSKKSSYSLIILLPVIYYFFSTINFKKIIIFSLMLLLAFITVRLMMIGLLEKQNAGREVLFFENPMYVISYSWLEKIAFGFHTSFFYIAKLILPYPLVVYYGYNAVELGTWSDLTTILGFVVVVGTLVMVILNIKKKRTLDFGILWLFIGIGMYANVLSPAVGIVAERFMFIPSVGFAIIVVEFIRLFMSQNSMVMGKFTRIGTFVLMAIFLSSCVYTINRNSDWKSRFSIYNADVKKVPESAKIHALLGAHYTNELENIRRSKTPVDPNLTKAKADSAKIHFSKAIFIYPGYTTMHNNLGTIYYGYFNMPDSALHCFLTAVEQDSLYAQAQLNLAISYERFADRYEKMYNFYSYFNPLDSAVSLNDFPNQEKVVQLFEAMQYFEGYLQSYISGLIYSGSKERVQSFQNEIPGLIDRGLNQYFATVELKPNRDSLIQKLSIGLRKYLSNEMFGDPLSLKQQVLFETFGKQAYEWTLNLTQLQNGYALKNYAFDHYNNYNKKIIHHLNFAVQEMNPGNYNKMMLAFDKLNKIYQKTGMGDSIISLNQRFLSNVYFQKELLIIEIGNGYLLKNNIPEALEWYKKSIDENLRIANDLKIIYQHLAAAGGSSHLLLADWYKSKIKQIGETYYKIASKLNEIGKGEEAQKYFAEAEKYKM